MTNESSATVSANYWLIYQEADVNVLYSCLKKHAIVVMGN